MRKFLFLVYLLFVNWGNCEICRGQQQVFYPFRKYGQANGLSSYNITKIIQDKYGFIWIGTQDGLNCFDGNNFLVFNREAPPRRQLQGNSLMDLAEDPEHDLLWLITSYGGIQKISTPAQAIQPFALSDSTLLSFNNNWLRCITRCGNLLWIGTYAGAHVYDLSHHRLMPFPILPKSGPANVKLKIARMLTDAHQRVWAFSDGEGALVFNGLTGKLIARIADTTLNTNHASTALRYWNATAHEENIYACTNWGLRDLVFRNGQIQLQPPHATAINDHEVTACVADSNGQLWVSDIANLYRERLADKRLYRITERNYENDAWQTATYALCLDARQRIWLGSEEGLSYFTPTQSPFEKYYRSATSKIKIQHAFAVYPINDSMVYSGAANGLYKVNIRNNTITQLQDASSCYLIAPLNPQQLLVSNSKGLFLLHNDQLAPVEKTYPELKPLSNDLLCAFTVFNDSLYLFASELRQGLYVWNTRRHSLTQYNSNNGLPLENGIINALYKDQQGKAWVLSENSLHQFNPVTGEVHSYKLQSPGSGLPLGILFDQCETDSSYWLAAYGNGLVETDKQLHVKRIFSTAQGLSNNGVYKVFAGNDSTILVTSNDGLSVLNTRTGKIRNYFEQDGLHGNAFEQYCGYSGKGVFFAGGVNGFTAIYPARFTVNPYPPKVYITRIKMETPHGSSETGQLELSSMDIPAQVYQATVYFAGLNFSNPEATRFAYRIRELNDVWTNIGNQHFINLIGLYPGHYHLEIRAANENNIWSTPATAIDLHFRPKWYQTIWFDLLVAAALLGLLLAFYRYRIAQLRKQQAIRQEIASDLHDDLGSMLNTAQLLTHLARREPTVMAHLDNITSSLGGAVTGLRDMIWVLDDDGDAPQDLMERIRRSVSPALHACGVQLEVKISENVSGIRLSKPEKRNLLLIARESINNSVKYAGCRHIRVRIDIPPEHGLRLTVEDDGKGFDVDTVMQGGHGLRNIRQRARIIGFTAVITSSNAGTVISVMKK